MAKRGRPKVEDPRIKSLGIRLTPDEYERIRMYASAHNMTVTELVLKGIDMVMSEPEK